MLALPPLLTQSSLSSIVETSLQPAQSPVPVPTTPTEEEVERFEATNLTGNSDSRLRSGDGDIDREKNLLYTYDPWTSSATQSVPTSSVRSNLQLPFSSQTHTTHTNETDNDDDDDDDDERVRESTRRLQLMLSATPPMPSPDEAEISVEMVLHDPGLSTDEKRDTLQHMLIAAASNGDTEQIRRLLDEQDSRSYVNVNIPDEDGTTALIYASCFGHEDVVRELVSHGADLDQQDKFKWSPLMWATNNNRESIVRYLVSQGASPDIKSASGRTARDFAGSSSVISNLIGSTPRANEDHGLQAFQDDYYNDGSNSPMRLEEQFAESELNRRMLMESAVNLEVDLSHFGFGDPPIEDGMMEDEVDFDWDHCLPDQMFVFSAEDIPKIIDLAVTRMNPLRSPSQKPVPANVLFLSARFAHHYGTPELLQNLLEPAVDRMSEVIATHEDDMAFLAFWLSNASLLVYYFRKDTSLNGATIQYQELFTEIVKDAFVLLIRDAERRLDRVLDAAILDHETIPGLDDIQFQREWRIFRNRQQSNPGSGPGPDLEQIRPPTPHKLAQPAPRNVTSLLSSTLFVMELYEIHPVVILQAFAQILYWLDATIFNRIMAHRKYLARTKAMQIRLNVSAIEDWARSNNRQVPEVDVGKRSIPAGESMMELARKYLSPLVQLLQWLQCFSSLGDDTDGLVATLQQLPELTAEQLLHAVKRYRTEVGEEKMSKNGMKYLKNLQAQQKQTNTTAAAVKKSRLLATNGHLRTASLERTHARTSIDISLDSPIPSSPVSKHEDHASSDEDGPPKVSGTFRDISQILPFVMPTGTEMLVTWGAGIGGVNRAQAQRHAPVLPPEFAAKLDATSSLSTGVPSIKSGVTGPGGGGGGGGGGGSGASGGRTRVNSVASTRYQPSNGSPTKPADRDTASNIPESSFESEDRRPSDGDAHVSALERKLVMETEIAAEEEGDEKPRWE
ncbi:hypothetical protein V1512DRAFT_203144 [Lipomyces arxii]|uniref:uncharacterized protein n=1 Tax=Lipomyces arxii TaxID=56418 RepID=UPI0034CFE6F0